jgi:hypothetical protein
MRNRVYLLCPGACIVEAEVPHDIDEELALKMYETMVKLQTMDVIFYEAQRQVRAGVCHMLDELAHCGPCSTGRDHFHSTVFRSGASSGLCAACKSALNLQAAN